MTIAQAYRLLVQALVPDFGEREAKSLARIVFEDGFGIRQLGRTEVLAPHQRNRLRDIQSRLLRGEPVQYILGRTQFYGLELQISPDVLIPRPETEELVHWILEEIRRGRIGPHSVALDVGTGSGCIAIALGHQVPTMDLWALDVSDQALRIARENAQRHGVSLQLVEADVLDPKRLDALPELDLIVSNPPYIPWSERGLMGNNVRAYEPPQALLVPDEDPLLFYRAITQLACRKLAEGGWLFFELNEHFAEPVKNLLRQAGFQDIDLRADMQGKWRMSVARKTHPA